VYGTSASSPDESSWGCYCPPQDKVNGKSIGSCLGDLYSVNWMEDSDKYGPGRTIAAQTAAVKQLTTMSKVMEWGDLSFTNYTIGEFQGDHAFGAIVSQLSAVEQKKEYSGAEGYTAKELREMSAVSTYDIPMHLAYYSYLRDDSKDIATSHALLSTLTEELNMRLRVDNVFMSLTQKIAGDSWSTVLTGRHNGVTNWECLDVAKAAYRIHCGEFTDYARKYVRVFNNMCALPGIEIAAIEGGLSALCEA